MPTEKECAVCKQLIGVASKTCQHCGGKQPYKNRLERQKEKIAQDWKDRQKKNCSINKVFDATNLLLHKWELLERYPVLLLARRTTGGFVADCFCPWQKDTEDTQDALVTIKRIYEGLLNVTVAETSTTTEETPPQTSEDPATTSSSAPPLSTLCSLSVSTSLAPPVSTPSAPPVSILSSPPVSVPSAPPVSILSSPPVSVPSAPPVSTPYSLSVSTSLAPPVSAPLAPAVSIPSASPVSVQSALSVSTPSAPPVSIPCSLSVSTSLAPLVSVPSAPPLTTPSAPPVSGSSRKRKPRRIADTSGLCRGLGAVATLLWMWSKVEKLLGAKRKSSKLTSSQKCVC